MNARGLLLLTAWMLGILGLFGCGSGGNERPPGVQTRVRVEFPSAASRYDLGRDEHRGGHTLERHVARTDEQLRERLAQESNISAASTWIDREIAETVVAEALAAEHSRVDSWMRRGFPRANLALHYNAGRVVGRSLRRGDAQAVDCTNVVVVLRADSPQDFYVLTTYPEARE